MSRWKNVRDGKGERIHRYLGILYETKRIRESEMHKRSIKEQLEHNQCQNFGISEEVWGRLGRGRPLSREESQGQRFFFNTTPW